MMNYEVGQVIYLLSQKSLNIVPALIVEEVTRKTVDNSTTEYVVEMPNEKGTRAKLSSVTSIIFNDISELREHMLENTRKSVEELISNAIKIKDIKFGGNYVDNGISEHKTNEVMNVFKEEVATSKKETDVKNGKTYIKTNQFKPKKQKLMQNEVKDVIMNGNPTKNNT